MEARGSRLGLFLLCAFLASWEAPWGGCVVRRVLGSPRRPHGL